MVLGLDWERGPPPSGGEAGGERGGGWRRAPSPADADLPTLIGCGCLALVVVISLAILVQAAFLHLAARIVRLAPAGCLPGT